VQLIMPNSYCFTAA